MAAFYLRLTALGLAAVATAIAEGSPLPLVDFALGDGGGAAYDPTGAETDLVNEVARAPIETVARDPAQADRVTVTAVVPAEEGGFWVRELGVFTEAGDLFAIGKYPEAYKPTIAEGASYDLQVAASMTIAAAADVTVSELSGDFYATRDWVRANADFFAVISADLAAPPAAPTAGDQYLIPADAAGTWAGQAGKIAHWRGAPEGWQFVTPPDGAQASPADSDLVWRKTAGVWAPIVPTASAINVAGGANVALTSAQAAGSIIVLSGALTADIVVTFPTKVGRWNLRNNTTGGFTVIAKTAGGGGVAVTQGAATDIVCDGVNIVLASSDLKGNATGAINLAQAADIPSAAAIDLGAVKGNSAHVTGSTGIGSFGNSLGARKGGIWALTFDGAPLLTHSASLILPTRANIQVAAGDMAFFTYEGGGVWRCLNFLRADGGDLVPGVLVGNLRVVGYATMYSTGNYSGPASLYLSNTYNIEQVGAHSIRAINPTTGSFWMIHGFNQTGGVLYDASGFGSLGTIALTPPTWGTSTFLIIFAFA